MGWQDKQFERTDEIATYPFIQWVNAGGNLDPRSPTGGFAMPLDQAEMVQEARIPGDLRVLHHRNGEQTEVIFTTRLEAAVLATRFTWIKDGMAIPEYEPGARGKLQALALIRDLDGRIVGPVLLTFRGMVGKQFSAALKEHRQTVRKATQGKAPSYAFLGKFQAGEVKMVGSSQKSPITTLVYVADDFDPDAAYIGDEAVDRIDWKAVDAWKAAWNGNGNGHINTDEDDEVNEEAVQEWDAVRLPFASKKYGPNATIGDLYQAGDVEALKALIAWCGDNPAQATVKEAAEKALEALQNDGEETEEEVIPF